MTSSRVNLVGQSPEQGWKKVELSELCDKVVDCPHSTPLWTDRGVIVLRNQNIRGGRLDLSSPSYTDELHFEERSRRARLQPGDLVLTREAPMGEVCIVPEGLRCCLGQRMVMLRPNREKCDPHYLLYAIQSKEVQHAIKLSEGTGATVSNLRIPHLKGLPIPTPPIAVQKAIAKILSSLDDKIELNRRMNATLEAMARALFKAWFVDFEPVHANKENRPSTSASPEIAKLFPSNFENGIPKGWAVERLGYHVEVLRGLSYKGAGLTDPESGVPMHNLNSIFEGGGYKYAGIKYYSGDYKERHIVRPGDVIVANTEQGHKHLLIGYPAIVPRYFGQESIFSHHIYRVRPNETGRLSPSYIYYSLMIPAVREVVVGCSSGTTVNMLKMDGLQIPKVPIPYPEIINKFSSFTDSIWSRTELSHRENQSLIETRDLLLPRLISGKLKVESSVAHYVEN